MSPNSFTILEGAYLISDAHYSQLRPELLGLIEAIHSKKLLPPQLILMGDIFDALFGDVAYTLKENKNLVNLLNEISQEIEVIYLEGNHDFNIREYFPNMKVFSLSQQPLEALYKEKTIERRVCLAHGDFDGTWSYKLYCKLIRSRAVVKFLTAIDSILNNKILKKLDSYLSIKEDCREFIGFREFILSRDLHKYNCDYFIEGHYHQNKQFAFDDFSYINLGAFACNQRYFVVKSSQDRLVIEEKRFSKGDVKYG